MTCEHKLRPGLENIPQSEKMNTAKDRSGVKGVDN